MKHILAIIIISMLVSTTIRAQPQPQHSLCYLLKVKVSPQKLNGHLYDDFSAISGGRYIRANKPDIKISILEEDGLPKLYPVCQDSLICAHIIRLKSSSFILTILDKDLVFDDFIFSDRCSLDEMDECGNQQAKIQLRKIKCP